MINKFNVLGSDIVFETYNSNETTSRLIMQSGGTLDNDVFQLYKQYLHSDDVFLDVGANIGWHTIVVSQQVKTVISVEPEKNNISLLHTNINRNNLKNVIVVEKALSDSVSQSLLTVSIKNSGGHILNMISNIDVDDFITHYTVETTTIDSLISEFKLTPTVIKIDVQGNEPVVLQGGSEYFKYNRPKIFLEIDPISLKVCGRSVFEILSFIDRFDYRPYVISDRLTPLSITAFLHMCERLSDKRGHYNDLLLVHESQIKEIISE
jgi:FkbM family methyltransferase